MTLARCTRCDRVVERRIVGDRVVSLDLGTVGVIPGDPSDPQATVCTRAGDKITGHVVTTPCLGHVVGQLEHRCRGAARRTA